MRDTSAAAEHLYFELLRSQTPLARVTTAARLCSAVRQLAEAAIRAEHPNATAAVVRAHLAARLYGRRTAALLFPDVKIDAA
jgi:hypothetical protein